MKVPVGMKAMLAWRNAVEPHATQTMVVKTGSGQTRLSSDQAIGQDPRRPGSVFEYFPYPAGPEDIRRVQHSKRTQKASLVVSMSRNIRHENSQLYVNGKNIISTGQFIPILM